MKKHFNPSVFCYLDFIGEREQDADVSAPDLQQSALKE
jgi:hypothetical protein